MRIYVHHVNHVPWLQTFHQVRKSQEHKLLWTQKFHLVSFSRLQSPVSFAWEGRQTRTQHRWQGFIRQLWTGVLQHLWQLVHGQIGDASQIWQIQNISTGPNGCEQKESERTEGLAFEATIQRIRFHDTSKPVRNMRKSSVNHPWKTMHGRFQAIHRALKAPSKVWSSSRSCRRSSATRRQLPKLFFSSWQYLSTKPCLKDSHSLWNSMKRYLNQHDYQILSWYYQLSTLYQPYINICPW